MSFSGLWDDITTVSFSSLAFDTRQAECVSTAGTRYLRHLRTGMPKLPAEMLDSVIYLYQDKEDAEAGVDFGGTGFLVTIPSEMFPDRAAYFYAVTNWHVVCRDGYSTIRINTREGADIISFDPSEWFFMPEFDIAVIPMPLNFGNHKAAMISTDSFVNKDLFYNFRMLGVGSDVFMIGRFIDHDGGQTNRPAARFGNISVLPAPIMQPNHKAADAFCIDMHSRTGYSGSPVFVYRLPGMEFSRHTPGANTEYLGLLGIHFAQFPDLMELKSQEKAEAEAKSLIVEGKYVKGLSGMTCVLPAWTILEVLKMPKLRQMRDDHAKEHYAPKFGNRSIPSGESASSSTQDNPEHKEAFTALLGEAAKKRPQVD